MAVNEDPSEHTQPSDLPPSVGDPQAPITDQERSDARNKEYQQIHDFGVKEEVLASSLSESERSQALQTRWVEIRKRDLSVRCRLVVKGYDEDVSELSDCFAATPTLATLKLVISLAISRGYQIYTGDISVAFLHADVIQTIHVVPPSDYQPSIQVPSGDSVLWKLLKALYGLKTAPKSWQIHLIKVLTSDVGFKQSRADPCLFYLLSDGKAVIFLIVYVDDLFLTGPELKDLQEIISKIKKSVLLRDVGWLNEGQKLNYLGRDLYRSGLQLVMSTPIQPVVSLIESYGLASAKVMATTGTDATDRHQFQADVKGSESQEPEAEPSVQVTSQDLASYRSAVGKLQWLTGTRPDIQFAVKELAREVSNLQPSSIIKLKHLLRYLKGTLHYALHFTQASETEGLTSELHVYCDANWACCQNSRKSTSGYVIFYMGNVICSASKTQHSVALSSAESELYAMCSAVTEAVHLSNLLSETCITQQTPKIHLYSDSQSAIAINQRSGPGKKSKHIQIRYLFVQDMVQNGAVVLHKVHTDNNCSDLQTKYIPTDKISKFTGMQMVSSTE